ncbi:outer membrane protein assembly factor BamD [Halpernia frigidisoli]|uniref:Beta-barrel assembly machine subunit BamD n=1 Tax=Halpernia frigidisoli TaxID=1125876 RepID=A0A1I3HTT1_9FLAO|nr:outer membrane protein assembly factor BamD [Halpernia frigidisoli]SFI39053.1 Beta-barrel assembly machine subunit BamD [Halpernia frigidisoli]
MKKYIIIVLAFFVVSSCNRQQDQAMKSADKDFILKVANENFANKKWKDALALYDRLPKLVAGTDDAPNVVFNSAYANYYDENYILAGQQFKNFSLNFVDDSRKEEAAYMSALCYYQGSMQYNLDQKSTESAINQLQEFLNGYPNSERSKNISQLIDELSYKLEFKAYENARQYYKMADYKAANVTFENVLNDFPATKLRPKIVDFILKSRYELAMNSVYDLKSDRIDNALSYTYTVEKDLPNSEYSSTAVKYRQNLEAEKVKFNKVKIEVDARKAELSQKQKIALEKVTADETQKAQAKDQVRAENKANQTLRDSAKLVTPPPAATFKIRR